MRTTSAATRSLRTSAAIHNRAPCTLPVTSWQLLVLRAPRPSLDGTIRQGFNPSCRIPTTRAAMTSLCTLKANLAFRRVPHASTCALPVRDLRRALCEQGTLRRSHRVSHTHARLENPSVPNPFNQPSFCPSWDRQHLPRTFPDRVSLAQASTRRPRAQHGPNLALAAVQTRRGSQNSYGRYSALVPLSPSSSPLNPRTPACYDAYTPRHDTHTRTCGCVLPHADRHLPYTQRPHTRCLSHIPCFTHSCRFTHMCRFPRTRGSTHTCTSLIHGLPLAEGKIKGSNGGESRGYGEETGGMCGDPV